MEKPKWIKDKEFDEDFSIIRGNFDAYKDWKEDNGCYVLIKVYEDTHEIGVAICGYNHVILKEFRGRIAQEIYHTIFKYSMEKGKLWFTRLDHAAYLGKELKKAEISLSLGNPYIQE